MGVGGLPGIEAIIETQVGAPVEVDVDSFVVFAQHVGAPTKSARRLALDQGRDQRGLIISASGCNVPFVVVNCDANEGPMCSSQLSWLSVDENAYKPDLEVGDRYQKISEEVARIALIGLGGIAFIVESGLVGISACPRALAIAWTFVLVASFAFGASVALALTHRFLANLGLGYHVEALRRDKQGAINEVNKCTDIRNKYYNYSYMFQHASIVSMSIATISLGIVFGAIAFCQF
jgi:hypothetical protein